MGRLKTTEYKGTGPQLHHFMRQTRISVGLLSTDKFPFRDAFLGPPQEFKDAPDSDGDSVHHECWMREETIETTVMVSPSGGASASASPVAPTPVKTVTKTLVFDPTKFEGACKIYKTMDAKLYGLIDTAIPAAHRHLISSVAMWEGVKLWNTLGANCGDVVKRSKLVMKEIDDLPLDVLTLNA